MAITDIIIHTEHSVKRVVEIGGYLKKVTTEISNKLFSD